MRASTYIYNTYCGGPAVGVRLSAEKIPLLCLTFDLFGSMFRVNRSISAQIIHAPKDISAATMAMIFRATVPKDETVPIAVKCHER